MRADLEELLFIAQDAARLAAVVHRQKRHSPRSVDTKRSLADLVTAVDREAAQQLVTAIRRARPNDAILGEEGTNVPGRAGVCWVLDPLDGTTNVVYGYPAHAIAVGVEIEGRRVLGVVYDTSRELMYTGMVGVVAHCEGQPRAVRTEAALSQALIGTGFPPDRAVRQAQGEVLRRLLPLVRDRRRSGCPALELCAVAAGAAIAEAAGATIVELQSDLVPSPVLVAANAQLLKALVAVLIEVGAATEPRAGLA
jgi:myo-inositol-1(or 4)-monophosphatase